MTLATSLPLCEVHLSLPSPINSHLSCLYRPFTRPEPKANQQ